MLKRNVNWKKCPSSVNLIPQGLYIHYRIIINNKFSTQSIQRKGVILLFPTDIRGFGGLGVACGFKPGQSRRIFKGEKILSTPSFGGEVKPSVPCCRFATCKRSLNGVEVVISAKLPDNIFAHRSHFRRCDLSRRGGRGGTWWWKVGTSEKRGKARTYPGYSHTSRLTALVSAQTGPRAEYQ